METKVKHALKHLNLYKSSNFYFKAKCYLPLPTNVEWGFFWFIMSVNILHCIVPFMNASNVRLLLETIEECVLTMLVIDSHLLHFKWSCCRAPYVPSKHLLPHPCSIIYWDLKSFKIWPKEPQSIVPHPSRHIILTFCKMLPFLALWFVYCLNKNQPSWIIPLMNR